MIKAVIFDIDGTLVDTVDMHAEAWRRAFERFGHDIDFAAIRCQIGKGGDQLMPVFLSKTEISVRGEAIEEFRSDLFKREYLPAVKGFPRVRDLFERLRKAGKKIALASSAKAEELQAYKKAANIDGLTDVETTSDDAEKSKPHPDIFQVAIERLGREPTEIVVVGDSPYDAEAAGKAGMRTVGLLCGGFTEDDLRGAGALEIYRDPADLLARYDASLLSA